MIMEFFDKLGKKATEAYKVTADKTGKIAKETKLKFKIGDLKTQINDIYEEIGKKVYEKHVREEEISIKKDLEEQCTKIDVLSDEIDILLQQCLELKDKKQCPKCFKEIEKDDKFCPNCGEKQVEETQKDSYQGTKEDKEKRKENDNATDDVINKEDNKKVNVQNTGYKKSNNNNENKNEKAKSELLKTVEVEVDPNLNNKK